MLDDNLDDDLLDDDDYIDARHVEGVDKARAKVEPWLKKMVQNPEDERDLGVTLYHLSNRGKREKDIWFQRLKMGDDVGEFVDLLLDEAADNCEMLRGRNKYQIRVRGKDGCQTFFLESPSLARDEHPMTARDFDDEPDMKGFLAQVMRHKEAETKLLLQVVHEWREEVKEEKDALRRENRELRQVEHGLRLRTEQVINMQFARDMEIRKVQRAEQRKDRALDQVAQIGRRLLEAKGILPPAPPPVIGEKAPVEAMVMQFVSSLTPEQFNPDRLTPQQRQSLEAIFTHIAQWQARRNSTDSQSSATDDKSSSQTSSGGDAT